MAKAAFLAIFVNKDSKDIVLAPRRATFRRWDKVEDFIWTDIHSASIAGFTIRVKVEDGLHMPAGT